MSKADLIQICHLRFNENFAHAEDFVFVLQYIRLMQEEFGFTEEPLYTYYCSIENSLTKRYIPNCWEIQQCCMTETDLTRRTVR